MVWIMHQLQKQIFWIKKRLFFNFSPKYFTRKQVGKSTISKIVVHRRKW